MKAIIGIIGGSGIDQIEDLKRSPMEVRFISVREIF